MGGIVKRETPEEHFAKKPELSHVLRKAKIEEAKDKQAKQIAHIKRWVKDCEYLKE